MAEETPGYKKYKGRTTGLNRREVRAGRRVGKAGRKTVTKEEAGQAMKDVDISGTEWRKASDRTGPRAGGGIVVSKETGQAITGKVKLPDGSYATYVRGKRVRANDAKPKPKPKPAPSGGTSGGGGGGQTPTPPPSGSNTDTPRPRVDIANYQVPEPNRRQMAMNRGRNLKRRGRGGPVTNPVSMSAYNPKDGETRTIQRAGRNVRQRYNAAQKTWVDIG